MILPPRPMTLARLGRLASQSNRSILRWLEYERISGLMLDGLTLDVGGGSINGYHDLLAIRGQMHSVNINRAVRPAYLADLNHPIPVASNTYDNVISLNTLEHIRADLPLVQEIHRILKPGSALFLVVPFLYWVHGSPSDYHRHTAFFWEEYLEQVGFAAEHIQIEPLTFGPLAAPLSLLETLIRPRWLVSPARFCWLGWSFLRQSIRNVIKPHAPPSHHDGANFALGYFITARK